MCVHAHAHQAAGQAALEFVAAGQVGGMRATTAHGHAEALRAAQRDIGAQLAGFRNRPPANAAALQGALVALSHLVEDFPCLRALDVNPLIADADGVLALDARIEIDPHDRRPAPNPDMATLMGLPPGVAGR